MRTWRKRLVVGVVIAILVALIGCSSSSSPSGHEPQPTLVGFFKLEPKATFLHTCTNPADTFYDDGALEALPISLADYGLAPGDSLLIEVEGEYFNGLIDFDNVIAVFSSSATLLSPSQLDRVPGAIEAGNDYETETTYGCGNEPTDIPEDFTCNPEVSVAIPAGATHLFICAEDSYYEDNVDDDNDFGVNVSKYE